MLKKIIYAGLGMVLLSWMFIAGTIFGDFWKSPGVNAQRIWNGKDATAEEVINSVESKFLGKVDEQKLGYSAIKGMVRGLGDQYTEFFSPDEAKVFWDDIGGKFEGIGIEIALTDELVKIEGVLPGSPAEEAKLKVGDMIYRVEGESIVGKTLGEVANKIKGKSGTSVGLSILRGEDLLEFLVERRQLVATSVLSREEGDVVWMGINRFDDKTQEELVAELNKYDWKTKKGVVLDLRGNPGGYFDSAVNIADMFLANGVIVKQRAKDGTIQTYESKPGDNWEKLNMIVLINEGSASASEILAGALHDNNRSKLVGKKTYGKGSVQEAQKLNDGSLLKITIAEWLTPNNVNLRESGIDPDVLVENKEDEKVDNQFNKAKELLELAEIS